jgi:hypothetical protein
MEYEYLQCRSFHMCGSHGPRISRLRTHKKIPTCGNSVVAPRPRPVLRCDNWREVACRPATVRCRSSAVGETESRCRTPETQTRKFQPLHLGSCSCLDRTFAKQHDRTANAGDVRGNLACVVLHAINTMPIADKGQCRVASQLMEETDVRNENKKMQARKKKEKQFNANPPCPPRTTRSVSCECVQMLCA